MTRQKFGDYARAQTSALPHGNRAVRFLRSKCRRNIVRSVKMSADGARDVFPIKKDTDLFQQKTRVKQVEDKSAMAQEKIRVMCADCRRKFYTVRPFWVYCRCSRYFKLSVGVTILNNPNAPTKNIGRGEIILLPECVCGHDRAKHLYDGDGGCNEFKCPCDSFVRAAEPIS